MSSDKTTTQKLVVHEIQGPDRRTTAQTPKPLQIETLLQDVLRETKETRDTIAKVDGKVESLSKVVVTMGMDVAKINIENAARARRHSGNISRVSDNDLKQDAAIAHVITEQAEAKATLSAILEKTDLQTEILKDLRSIAANPMVRRVGYAIGIAILGYLASRGVIVK